MPKLEYFLVCESVSIDRDTNRVSHFHVLEELRPGPSEQPGHLLAQLAAVCCWYEEPDDVGQDFQALLRLHTPEGNSREFTLNFHMKSRRQRLVFHLQGIPPVVPGELKFEILLNGKHQAEHIVTVHPPATPEDRSRPVAGPAS
jgi:hypothetical protein